MVTETNKKMKKIKILLLILCVTISFAVNSQSKVAHVNTIKIMESMPAAIAAQTEIINFTKTYEESLKDMQKNIEEISKRYGAEESTQSKEVNERRMQELQEHQISIQNYYNQSQQDIKKKQLDVFMPINEKVLEAINTVVEALGLDYVFESPMQGLLVSKGKDITEDVKKELGIE